MGNSAQRRAVKNYLIRAYYEWVVWVVRAFKGRPVDFGARWPESWSA